MKRKASGKRGFTLIEVLVVMVIIMILSGITFKIWGMSMRSAKKAKTIEVLQRVAHALEEFKSEYGQYPPVSSVTYQHENFDALMNADGMIFVYPKHEGERIGRPIRMGLSCFYYAAVHLPVAEATVLHYVQPAITAVLAAWLLREAPGRAVIASILAAACQLAIRTVATTVAPAGASTSMIALPA